MAEFWRKRRERRGFEKMMHEMEMERLALMLGFGDYLVVSSGSCNGFVRKDTTRLRASCAAIGCIQASARGTCNS
jgi:hypothetical protein